MENENQTPMEPNQEQNAPTGVQEENNIPQSQKQTEMPLEKAAEPSVETAPLKPKRRWLQYTIFSFLALVIAGAGYLGYTNPQLFKAQIEPTGVVPSGQARLYIPEYNSSPQDIGKIAIKIKDLAAIDGSEELVSMQFKLSYSPIDALSFNENSIVFEPNDPVHPTLFSSADLKGINTNTPGEVIVSFFSNDGVTVDEGNNDDTLFKLAVEVDGASGSDIDLSVDDVEVVQRSGAIYDVSDLFTGVDTLPMHLITQSDLRVLNAEALDSTHVLVRFSDLLSDIGTGDDYTIGGDAGTLKVTVAESGFLNGYDQSTVMLTTTPQVPGSLYGLSVDAVEGNVEGNLSGEYIGAIFYGYDDTVSSVTLQSAETLSSTLVVLHFSGALAEDTVTPVNVKIKYDSAGVLA